MFQVFKVHSPEAPLYGTDKPRRKRKRVEFSGCEHTNELRSMWTYLEGLAAQLGVLEEVKQVRDHQDSVTYKTALAGAAVISHNVPVLEEEEKANLNSQSPPSLPPSSRVYRCPAFNCTQYFQRVDLFHQHIRSSYTNGHKILKNIIDQTCCLRCDESFTRSKDLVNHERSLHGEQYGSRVYKFTGSQGQDDQGQDGQGQDDQCQHDQYQDDQGQDDQGQDDQGQDNQGQDDQGQDDQRLGNNRKRVDNSPISSPNPDPPQNVALKDISEATDYMPTTTKAIGNVYALQHDSLPHLSTNVSEPNIEFAEPSNADLFSYSAFHVFHQPPEGDPCGIPRDSSPNSNAQVWGGNFQFAAPSNADLFSHSAFHVFQQPVEDPYVLQHDSLPNSNAQMSRVGVELHEPSSVDVFPHPSQLLFEQHVGGQFSTLDVQFAEPLDRDIFAHSSLNFFSEPPDEELFAWQDRALVGTSPPSDIRYLQSLDEHP